MTDPFIGEIRLFAFTFAPNGWALCDGRMMSIAQNTALFALIGTFYGGDGKVTFALPDLRGRVAISFGQGPGQPSDHLVGEFGGEETVTLTTNQLPSHNHLLAVNATEGPSPTPEGTFPGAGAAYADASNTFMAPQTVTQAGAGAEHNNVQPYLALNYCIALEGIFPSHT